MHRADDQPETIRRRLQIYGSETEPLIRYYLNAAPATVVFVDAARSAEDVQEEIRAAVGGVRASA